VSATDQGAGVATYRLAPATGEGYTLLGSPTVIANLNVTGEFPLIAARLWDVDPASNAETLVARGVYRIDPNAPDGTQVFQLHPGAWHFAAGHIPKLELLGQDSRTSARRTASSRSRSAIFSFGCPSTRLLARLAPRQPSAPPCHTRVQPRAASRARTRGSTAGGPGARGA
jgi:hypothetical protein